MNKQQLANKIWESANKMRSKIEANEYKDYILGFIFYKYLSDMQVKFLIENDYTDEYLKEVNEDDEETVKFVQRNLGYFISYENLFSTWIDMGKDFDVSNVTDALSAFSRLIYPTHKKVFDRIFHTLETGLSKLGESSGARTKAISDLISLIKDIPMDGKQGYDVLGFIYEYLISMFAANAGKKAGEFYTPHEVSVLMSEIVADHLKGQSEIKIYDPTSGSGSLLINIGQSIEKYIEDKNNIKYYAQELKENTYNLTRMNLVMRGIKPDNIVTRNGDTLEEDWPFFEEADPVNSYDPLYVDAVVSNPPYSQAWDPSNKENDPRYSRFGLAPKTKADYAFLLHDLFHIKPEGIMTIVLPHGVLFRGGEEGKIRENLIEQNHIDAVIGLPANIFFGTGIPTIIIILKQKRANTDVLIVDASKGFIKEGKNNKLRASDIKRITDVVATRSNINKYSRKVSREEIRRNEYNLNIPRYVDSSEAAESFDIYASMFGGIPRHEISLLKDYWEAFPNLKNCIFKNTQEEYLELAVEDPNKVITEHNDTIVFKGHFAKKFDSFQEYLKAELIDQIEEISVSPKQAELANNIFNRLEGIRLIDCYDAYELLEQRWKDIATDIEVIQTEGFQSTKQVDANMVIKKKNGKDTEVQEGFVGHVIPFELVQKEQLKEQLDILRSKENRLAEIPSLYEEIIDNMTTDEKESNVFNDEGTALIAKEVTKKIKELKVDKHIEEVATFLDRLKAFEKLNMEEKKLKKEIKIESAELHMLTKEKIENLSDNEVRDLLVLKWIVPLVEDLDQLTDVVIKELVTKIDAIMNKYAVTYSNLQKEIRETEESLCKMLDELVGNEYDMLGLKEFKSLLGGV